MGPLLSRRLAVVRDFLPFSSMSSEQWWSFVKRAEKVEAFEDLEPADQKRVLTAEDAMPEGLRNRWREISGLPV